MSGSPVLVTGATGNVGRAVVGSLLAAGQSVRAAVGSHRELDLIPHLFPDAGSQVRGVVLDFTDPATWSAYQDVGLVFLMRPPHLGRPRSQMLPSLEAMSAAGASGLGWTFARASFFMQNLTTTHAADVGAVAAAALLDPQPTTRECGLRPDRRH